MPIAGPVLAATDLSDAADEALRQGHRLARALGTRFVVCHVLPDVSQVRVLFPHAAGMDPAVGQAMEAKAREAVQTRVATVLGERLPAEDLILESGSAHAGIRAAGQRVGAHLVVLGPGGTAARVAHHAAWAVLAARPSPADGDVLAATDFSDPALPAVAAAAHEAARRGVGLRLLHVVDLDPAAYIAVPGAAVVLPPPVDVAESLTTAARAQLDAALRRFGTPGTPLVAHGPAALRIVAAAVQPPAALVVVGTHGRTGIPRWLLGSVADRVIRDAPCSVLAVPLAPGPPAAEAGAA